jgi:hypothetical protein
LDWKVLLEVKVVLSEQKWYIYSVAVASLLRQSKVKTTRVMETSKEGMPNLIINLLQCGL